MANKIFIVVVNEIRIHKIRRAVVAESQQEAIALALLSNEFNYDVQNNGVLDLGDGATCDTIGAKVDRIDAEAADRELIKMELSQDWDEDTVNGFLNVLDGDKMVTPTKAYEAAKNFLPDGPE